MCTAYSKSEVTMAIDIAPATSDLMLTHKAYGLELNLDDLQGMWTEQQYLTLTDHTNHLLELTDGEIEVLAMPTDKHQVIVRFVFFALFSFIQPRRGTALFAPLRLRIRAGSYREPDILLVLDEHDPRRQNQFWLGADLVVEVVSPDKPERDLVTKRADYAEAGIPEYWIVNPLDDTITVLVLSDQHYAEHGIFTRGMQASSVLLDGFGVDVAMVFDAT